MAVFLDAGGCLGHLQAGCHARQFTHTPAFRHALRVALGLLGALGIPTLPVWGSALAVARGLEDNPVAMPWDDDIDVAIDEDGVQKLFGTASGLESRGSDPRTERCGPLDVACNITNTKTAGSWCKRGPVEPKPTSTLSEHEGRCTGFPPACYLARRLSVEPAAIPPVVVVVMVRMLTGAPTTHAWALATFPPLVSVRQGQTGTGGVT